MAVPNLTQRLRKTLPKANIDIVALPKCPDLRLGLINADFPIGPLDGDTMRAVIAKPAYWAFCWGSGLALAQYLFARPELVTGKRVLDIGSGSGVAGIAAALAGATRVYACDTDPDALAATAYNADLNGVVIELVPSLGSLTETCDIALLADVLYDKTNLPLLQLAQTRASEILVADSRIKTLPNADYEEVAQLEAITHPNLGEFDEFGTTRVFALTGSSLAATTS